MRVVSTRRLCAPAHHSVNGVCQFGGIEHWKRTNAVCAGKCRGFVELWILDIWVGQCAFSLVPPINAPVRSRIRECRSVKCYGFGIIFVSDNCNVGGLFREFGIDEERAWMDAWFLEMGCRESVTCCVFCKVTIFLRSGIAM